MSAAYASDTVLREPEVIATSNGRRPNPLRAVVIGTAVVLAAGAAITALGVAIGASMVDAVARDMPDAWSFALAGGAWVTVVVAVAAGAFVAGRLAYCRYT